MWIEWRSQHHEVRDATLLDPIRRRGRGQSQPPLPTVGRRGFSQLRIGPWWVEQGAQERDLFASAQTNGLMFLDDSVGRFLPTGDDEFTQSAS